MAKISSASSGPSPVRSAERMLAILSWFSEDHPTGRIVDIARDLDLSPSTVRRLISTLEQRRYLVCDDISGHYRPHVEVVRLAQVAVNAFDLAQLALPLMDTLMRDLNETLVLSILDRGVVIHVDIRQSQRPYSIYLPTGRRYNAYEGGASGRVLLAWKSSEELAALLPSDPRWRVFTGIATLTRKSFLSSLDETRRLGYAVSDGETDPDVWAVAAPIYDHLGDVCASLSAAARRRDLGPARKLEVITSLTNATREMSRLLCHDMIPSP